MEAEQLKQFFIGFLLYIKVKFLPATLLPCLYGILRVLFKSRRLYKGLHYTQYIVNANHAYVFSDIRSTFFKKLPK